MELHTKCAWSMWQRARSLFPKNALCSAAVQAVVAHIMLTFCLVFTRAPSCRYVGGPPQEHVQEVPLEWSVSVGWASLITAQKHNFLTCTQLYLVKPGHISWRKCFPLMSEFPDT